MESGSRRARPQVQKGNACDFILSFLFAVVTEDVECRPFLPFRPPPTGQDAGKVPGCGPKVMDRRAGLLQLTAAAAGHR